LAKSNLFVLIEAIIVVAAGFLLITGLIPPGNLGFQIGGLVASLIGFALTILITAGSEGEDDVDDITLVNSLLYPLIVGDILTIGSWFDTDPVTQSLILDLGLIVGLFIVFIYIWYLLREKVKGGLAFLDMDVLDLDFHREGEENKYPKFFIVIILLGLLFGVLFIILKGIYNGLVALNLGPGRAYTGIAYTLMGIVVILSLAMAFGVRIANWIRGRIAAKPAKSAKTTETSPAEKPKE